MCDNVGLLPGKDEIYLWKIAHMLSPFMGALYYIRARFFPPQTIFFFACGPAHEELHALSGPVRQRIAKFGPIVCAVVGLSLF
jgi:hypothetical protein